MHNRVSSHSSVWSNARLLTGVKRMAHRDSDVLDDAPALELFERRLRWSDVHPVSEMRREVLPDRPGIYIFTRTPTRLNAIDTLYVGKADGARTSLRQRVWGYCVTPIPASCSHRGRQLIFQYRQANHDKHLYVRWAVYSAASDIEGALIYLLTPTFNSRWELMWADEHDIDDHYVGDPYQGSQMVGRRLRVMGPVTRHK